MGTEKDRARTFVKRLSSNVRRRTFNERSSAIFFRSHSNDRMTIVIRSCDDRDRSHINVIWTFYDRSCSGWRRNEFESAWKFSVPLNFFGSTSTISCFYKHFHDGQYSLVSFLFAVLLVVPSCAQTCVKVGALAPVLYGVGATGQRTKRQKDESFCPFVAPSLLLHKFSSFYKYYTSAVSVDLVFKDHRHFTRFEWVLVECMMQRS